MCMINGYRLSESSEKIGQLCEANHFELSFDAIVMAGILLLFFMINLELIESRVANKIIQNQN